MNTGFVQAGLVKLQYFEHGSGPETVVLVHGYQSSGRIWRLTQEALDPARFRTIAISNRGAGDSDRTSGEAGYGIPQFAADLNAAVTSLGVRDFTLVGHSLGGKTVTQFTLDHQDLVKALVLLDSGSLDGRPLTPGWEDEVRAAFPRRPGAADERPAPLETPPPADFKAALDADIDRNPIERMIGSRRSMADMQLRSRAGELRMPVLVVGGDQDKTVGIDVILTDFLTLPAGRRYLHVLHGAGHSPNVTRAGELATVLSQFVLTTVPAALAAAR